jgi:hypothetical protein
MAAPIRGERSLNSHHILIQFRPNFAYIIIKHLPLLLVSCKCLLAANLSIFGGPPKKIARRGLPPCLAISFKTDYLTISFLYAADFISNLYKNPYCENNHLLLGMIVL